MPDRIIAGVGILGATTTLNGSLDGVEANKGAITATLDNDVSLNGLINLEDSEVNGNVNYSGNLAGQNAINGATSATLTLRVGQDGQDGKDGFSPTITVHKDTTTEYVLKITDINGSYLTPNLYPDLEGLQDVVTLVANKVDEDLAEYSLIQPTTLNAAQRENSFLYVHAVGLNAKIPLSAVALEQEVIERIGTKLQTVTQVPSRENWTIGDYILLDVVPNNN